MPHILLLGAQADTMFSFRKAFIKALIQKGYTVTVAAPDFNSDIANKLSELGARFRQIPFKRAGMNPFDNILALYRMYSSMKDLRPEFFLGITIKPSTLGVIAAKMAGVPNRFALVSGLGYAFTEGRGIKRRVANVAARAIYKFAFNFVKMAIFENDDDKALFVAGALVKEARTARVNGSGVDLARFAPAPFPESPFTFLMIGRLLEDKGVREYVASARIVKRLHPETRFLLIGARDQNPTAVTEAELQSWTAEGVIEYGGTLSDVRPAIARCHVFVLPSYREGLPTVVSEAMAMGRPIITTDTPGCRETVLEGLNGVLIPARDVQALVSAELRMISSPGNLIAYGEESHSLAERKFDIKIVIGQLLALLGRSDQVSLDDLAAQRKPRD
jgi:glycosyltransferase involved in cell wall biosynthesis